MAGRPGGAGTQTAVAAPHYTPFSSHIQSAIAFSTTLTTVAESFISLSAATDVYKSVR